MAPMVEVILRVIEAGDLPSLTGGDSEFDDWGPQTALAEVVPGRLDENGGLAALADGDLAGFVSWHFVQWGPGTASRCPNIGIWLIGAQRGKGVGAAAQRQLAELFFAHTALNRVDATTDVENIAEQRALERAGFTRDGRIRGSQWRAGAYHDMYLYSVLRGDLA
jgi:RimJ/RimL family protein N-acetyltransferase